MGIVYASLLTLGDINCVYLSICIILKCIIPLELEKKCDFRWINVLLLF